MAGVPVDVDETNGRNEAEQAVDRLATIIAQTHSRPNTVAANVMLVVTLMGFIRKSASWKETPNQNMLQGVASQPANSDLIHCQ